jgi:hypothetical protein
MVMPANFPPTKNPVFAMIVARRVRPKPEADLLMDPQQIRDGLMACPIPADFPPDAMILGGSAISLPLVCSPDGGHMHFASPFFLFGQSVAACHVTEGVSFGVGLCLLLFALDWIQLGRMP